MKELTFQNFKNCIYAAKEFKAKYLGVRFKTDDDGEDTTVIHHLKDELSEEYYMNIYNGDFDGVAGFTYGDSFEEIEKDLIG